MSSIERYPAPRRAIISSAWVADRPFTIRRPEADGVAGCRTVATNVMTRPLIFMARVRPIVMARLVRATYTSTVPR